MRQSSLAEAVNRTIEDVIRTRDEVRLQLHLGGGEARARWRVLEADLTRALAKAREFGQSTARAIDEFGGEMRKLRISARRTDRKPSPARRNGSVRAVP